MASSLAIAAWQGSQEDKRTMKRVLRSVASLPINSTLNNVTLLYFAVNKLEWIRDPMREPPQEMIQSRSRFSNWNPFNSDVKIPGTFALIPDAWVWWPLPQPITALYRKPVSFSASTELTTTERMLLAAITHLSATCGMILAPTVFLTSQ